jgi:hypothetical protein
MITRASKGSHRFANPAGIEPTIRCGAELSYIAVVVEDAWRSGDKAAKASSLESLKFAGVAFFGDAATISKRLRSQNDRSA